MLRRCWIVDMSWLCLITNTTTSCQWAKCGEDVEWGQCWYANILCCFFLSIIKCNQLPVNILPTQHSPLVVNWKGLSALFGRNLAETLTAQISLFLGGRVGVLAVAGMYWKLSLAFNPVCGRRPTDQHSAQKLVWKWATGNGKFWQSPATAKTLTLPPQTKEIWLNPTVIYANPTSPCLNVIPYSNVPLSVISGQWANQVLHPIVDNVESAHRWTHCREAEIAYRINTGCFGTGCIWGRVSKDWIA